MEEASAAVLVETLAARLGIDSSVVIVSHRGKSDLERSVHRKISAWRHPGDARFLIARDNDGTECKLLKARLLALVPHACSPRVKIRLVMQQLEAWYLGDLEAVAAGGLIDKPTFSSWARRAPLRDPDRLTNAAEMFARLTGEAGKIGPARQIAPHLSLHDNRSTSFRCFISALRWVAEPPAA